MTAANQASEELTADAFARRVFNSFIGALDTLAFYAGERMGWFQALADQGPLSSAELAEHTGTNERYAREWSSSTLRSRSSVCTTCPDRSRCWPRSTKPYAPTAP